MLRTCSWKCYQNLFTESAAGTRSDVHNLHACKKLILHCVQEFIFQCYWMAYLCL